MKTVTKTSINAAFKAWRTRLAKDNKRSRAAMKAWKTRRTK